MANMILYRVLPIAAATATQADASAAGSGGGNLASPEPKEVWVGPSFAGQNEYQLNIDFGAVQRLDCVTLAFLRDWIAGSYWRASGGVAGYAELALFGNVGLLAPSAFSAPLRQHGFASFAAVDIRYLRLTVRSPSNISAVAGIVAAGLAVTTGHNREKGGGRPVIDLGERTARPDGGFGRSRGARKGGFRWTWGDLADGELETLHRFALDVGETDPVVVVEDPDPTAGLNERIHYGLMDRFEPFERGDPSKHRWSMSMTEWV